MAGSVMAGPVPALGEHGPAVLERVLGRKRADVEKLVKEGVLCRPN
jgi:hypothetical protein